MASWPAVCVPPRWIFLRTTAWPPCPARQSRARCPAQLRIMHVEGDSMAPTLLDGDAVLVDMTRQMPNPPGIFVLDDGMGLVAKRLEHIPNSDPPAVRVISDNKLYPEYERTADEIRIIGRIRWFAREM
ncbi:S24 family peptidase [Yoonia sp.]|uniref:S24 family peptidase n=1 Tax=Yoonia sp. TaxID=2212373 RepID=UPI004047F837